VDDAGSSRAYTVVHTELIGSALWFMVRYILSDHCTNQNPRESCSGRTTVVSSKTPFVNLHHLNKKHPNLHESFKSAMSNSQPFISKYHLIDQVELLQRAHLLTNFLSLSFDICVRFSPNLMGKRKVICQGHSSSL
jgi:hypothetical protein